MKAMFRLGRLSAKEYEYLHDGLSSTAKGQAFLAEYLQNNRPNDVKSLASSLERMENRLTELGTVLQPQRISGVLQQIAIELAGLPQKEIRPNSSPADTMALQKTMRANIDHAVSELERLADAMGSLTYALDAQNEDEGFPAP